MASRDLQLSNFEFLTAYVLPGFTALRGLPFLTETTRATELAPLATEPTVAGFLFETVEAVTAGLTVSAVRWLLIDTLHHRTGLRPPAWDFAKLDKNVAAFELLIHIHYRYYKFYSNMIVALLWACGSRGTALSWHGLVYAALAGLFFLCSRDALRKYYDRAGKLLAGEGKSRLTLDF